MKEEFYNPQNDYDALPHSIAFDMLWNPRKYHSIRREQVSLELQEALRSYQETREKQFKNSERRFEK